MRVRGVYSNTINGEYPNGYRAGRGLIYLFFLKKKTTTSTPKRTLFQSKVFTDKKCLLKLGSTLTP